MKPGSAQPSDLPQSPSNQVIETAQHHSMASETQGISIHGKHVEQIQAYLAFYNLDRDPFDDAGTSGLFFPGAGRKQAVDSLLHFLRYGNTPVFLAGQAGSGKSSVLVEFIRQLESDVDVAVVNAALMMSLGQVLGVVVNQLGLNDADWRGSSPGSRRDQLLSFAKNTVANDRQVLICIDNTQDLTAEVINAVFELVASSQGDLRILWVGEPQATSILEEAGHKTDLLVNRIELPQFKQEELTDYIVYRLESAGFAGEMPLTEIQLQALLYRSQGNLEQLHKAARSMLMAAVDGPRQRPLKPFPVIHTATIAVLLFLLVVVWQQDSGPLNLEPQDTPIVLKGVRDRGDDVVVVQPQAAPAKESIGNDPDVTEDIVPRNTEQVRAAITEKLDQLAPAVDSETSEGVTRAAGQREPAPVDDTGLSSMASTGQEITGKLQQEVSASRQDSLQEPENAARGPEPTAAVATQDNPADTAIDAPVTAEVVASFTTTPAHKRLLAWPELGYALQVFGTHNAKRAKQLVDQYFGEADLLYYETRHNGKPWYVVVNGPYSGREAAKSSINNLPENLRRLRPWPRNIASIQGDIKRFSAAIEAEKP